MKHPYFRSQRRSELRAPASARIPHPSLHPRSYATRGAVTLEQAAVLALVGLACVAAVEGYSRELTTAFQRLGAAVASSSPGNQAPPPAGTTAAPPPAPLPPAGVKSPPPRSRPLETSGNLHRVRLTEPTQPLPLPAPSIPEQPQGWEEEPEEPVRQKDDWEEEPKEPGKEDELEQLKEPQEYESSVTQKVRELSADETTALEVARQLLNVRNTGSCPIRIRMACEGQVADIELAPGDVLDGMGMGMGGCDGDVTFTGRGVACATDSYMLEYDK